MTEMCTVQGYCPMGCGQTLFLGDGGYVTCCYGECPERSAAADILENRETEHIVEFGDASFSVQHPLRERLNGDLFVCGLHQWIANLPGPPVRPGRYRATVGGPQFWHFAEVPA